MDAEGVVVLGFWLGASLLSACIFGFGVGVLVFLLVGVLA